MSEQKKARNTGYSILWWLAMAACCALGTWGIIVSELAVNQ